MRILSVNTNHDAAAVVLNDGEIECYYKEERLTKRKRDSIPLLSTIECVKNCGGSIDYVLTNTSTLITKEEYILYFDSLSRISGIPVDAILESGRQHHLSHASLSFYNSGFKEALCIVVDGEGSRFPGEMWGPGEISECESVYVCSYPCNFIPLFKNFKRCGTIGDFPYDEVAPDIDLRGTLNDVRKNFNCECNYVGRLGGIVNLYVTATRLINQHPLENGKTMGLSSYGEKTNNFPHFFKETVGEVNEDYFVNSEDNLYPAYKPYYGKRIKEKVTPENYKLYADYAYEIQKQTQEEFGNLIEKAVQRTGIKNVCIVGGYGMNVVANHYYLQRFPELEFYFEPLADDGGIPIGEAKLFHHKHNNDNTIRQLKDTFQHGRGYDISSYKGITSTVSDVAQLLYDNKSVAVFRGKSESGQRALGNRSILFNALHPQAKEIVNKIKNREWYRPFAGIVLEEDAPKYFDMGRIKSSPFMTICFPVKSDAIPGIIHVDNTCRIQTVSKEDGYLYELLDEFKRLSGHGILLNTSFNLAGEPLVETPKDAFRTLNKSSLNYMWLEETSQLFS